MECGGTASCSISQTSSTCGPNTRDEDHKQGSLDEIMDVDGGGDVDWGDKPGTSLEESEAGGMTADSGAEKQSENEELSGLTMEKEFKIDMSLCPQAAFNDQTEELEGLGVYAYDQTQLEINIMNQLNEAMERQKEEAAKAQAEKELSTVKEEIRSVKMQLNQIEKALAMAPKDTSQMSKPAKRRLHEIKSQQDIKQKQLKKLQARECSLMSRLGITVSTEDQDCFNDNELNEETKLQLENIFKETEEERLIRMGEMTPFGTVMKKEQKTVRTIKLSDATSMTEFEKYLLTEAEEKAKKKVSSVKKSPAKPQKSSTVPSSPLVVDEQQPSTSKGLTTMPVRPVPAKRAGKERLGSSFANGFVPKRKKMSTLNENYRSDPELSDFENGDFSDEDKRYLKSGGNRSSDEYLPDEDEEFSDGDYAESSSNKKKLKKGAKKATLEMSDDEMDSKGTKSSKLKRLVDDGNHVAYVKRIKAYRKQKLLEKHQRIMDGVDDEDSEDECTNLDGEYRIPNDVWNKLYRYQQTGVRWLWELHQQNCGGIIGDEMGLGKTIQVIAFLAGLHYSKLQTDGDMFTGLGPVILVCPATVMHQWVKEFHTWWPPLRIGVLHVSGSFSGKKEALIEIINKSNGVLITSYAGIVIYQDSILKYEWHYIILDEGHKIRNPDAQATLACKQVRTPHRIILSGSPIQNNLKELWSLFDFVFPGKLGTLPVFMQQFSVPITQGGYSNASEVQVQTAYKCATVLRDTIKPYLLRRMKSDVKMTLQLPDKNEQVLFCRLTDEQRELYKGYLESPQIAQIVNGSLQIFVGLINLRKICNHPDIFSGGPKIFKEMDTSELSEDMKYGYYKRSGKMIVVDALLRLWHKQGHRVLLFTQSRQMLNIMKDFIEVCGYTYMWMDGTTSIGSRQPAIAKFNDDKSIFLFLLTTRVGGLGVNLTGANRVIIYDPDWNPSTDVQARERAWRIGQSKQVTIYRLLTAGTIEEKIYHRQIFKQYLTNRVLKDPRQRRFFKTNDLHELFTLASDDTKQTETSVIFAGTGSEVKLPKLKKSKHASKASGCAEVKDGVNGAPAVLDEKKLERMKALAKSLSQRIAEKGSRPISSGNDLTKQPSSEETNVSSPLKSSWLTESGDAEVTRQSQSESTSSLHQHEKSKEDKHRKHKKKKKEKTVVIDGEQIDHVVKHDVFKPASQEEEAASNLKQDEYVLQKLFKKAAVHTAMKHDVIEGSSNPDYVLVEGEAERVAREAVQALKQSRRQCFSATSGIPTWTGRSGASGAPNGVKQRFGQKKNPRLASLASKESPSSVDSADQSPRKKFGRSSSVGTNSSDNSLDGTAKDSRALSSRELMLRMKQRKDMVLSQNDGNRDEDGNNSDPGTSQSSLPRESTEYDELLVDIRNFVAFQASVDGQATTQEVLDTFRHRLPPKDAPVFKALLRKICTFRRRADGTGVWHLNPEFR